MDSRFPDRKQPAHGVHYVEGQPTIVFDAVCTKDRKQWLANDGVHLLLREVWSKATVWLVGRYLIMPDHIHLFAALAIDQIEFKNWSKFWKSNFTQRHKVDEHRGQTSDWDTRMRTLEQYEEKWNYVRMNPVRQGLVERSEDWPFQGVQHYWRWD